MGKKICFFCGDIARIGGTERVTTVIANELSARGFDVTILSVRNGSTSAFPLAEGIKLRSLDMQDYRASLSDTKLIRKLRTFIKTKTIEYLIDVDIILSYYSILATALLDTKIISWEHFYHDVNMGDLGQKLRRRAARTLAAKYSFAIVTLTETDRTKYKKKYGEECKVISINNPMTRKDGPHSSKLEKAAITVGRLAPEKGFDQLIEAWEMVHSEEPDWILRIVGSGNQDCALREKAKCLDLEECIIFVASTPNLEILYGNSSIYVLSSQYEGFGMVLLEAKSHGLPIISFDCDCGPREIVKHDYDGILVEPNNTRSLSKAIIDLIRNESQRITFGDRAALDNRFNIDKIITKWIKLLS